jgi:hypothetical protein
VGSVFPLLKRHYPILPVRIAECLQGKTSPSRIFVIIPAHLFGGIIGILFFRTFFPFLPSQVRVFFLLFESYLIHVFLSKVYSPITYDQTWWVTGSLTEIFCNFIYIIAVVILPEIFEVNRLKSIWVNLPMIPLFWFSFQSTYNPAVVYGLWYIQSCSLYKNVGNLPVERILIPLVASILVGIFVNMYFPEDPSCWIKKKTM